MLEGDEKGHEARVRRSASLAVAWLARFLAGGDPVGGVREVDLIYSPRLYTWRWWRQTATRPAC